MKKFLLFLCFLIFGISNIAGATVMQYNAGTYQTPQGWGVVSSVAPIDLDHYYYYQWGMNDLDPSTQLTSVNIVFHGIHDWLYGEQDWLNLYIKDGASSPGWTVAGIDMQSLSNPDWAGMGYNSLGTWSDSVGWNSWTPSPGGQPTYDVIFTIDGALLSYLQGGNGFTIGIDPDCHYWGGRITVEAPVPEPATMLLFGVGLCGLAFAGRKKLIRHG